MSRATEPTTKVEIPSRLIPFVDELATLGVFGIGRAEVITHLLQREIADLYGKGLCGKARAELERARASR